MNRYGRVKIVKTLNKRGVNVNERTVSRIMSKNNWKSCTVINIRLLQIPNIIIQSVIIS
ncbi:IS3 family transposase [Cytobacillus sp. FSL R5-0596]|uniref:IS3 family transposase n=1 Tax=Cytobacillus sp. FSL R5-0596 TaxID=2954696 RepID=UPI004046CC55